MKGALYALALNQPIDSDRDNNRDRDATSTLSEDEASLALLDMLLKANPEVASTYRDSNSTFSAVGHTHPRHRYILAHPHLIFSRLPMKHYSLLEIYAIYFR